MMGGNYETEWAQFFGCGIALLIPIIIYLSLSIYNNFPKSWILFGTITIFCFDYFIIFKEVFK